MKRTRQKPLAPDDPFVPCRMDDCIDGWVPETYEQVAPGRYKVTSYSRCWCFKAHQEKIQARAQQEHREVKP